MKTALITLFALMLAACGGGGSDAPEPVQVKAETLPARLMAVDAEAPPPPEQPPGLTPEQQLALAAEHRTFLKGEVCNGAQYVEREWEWEVPEGKDRRITRVTCPDGSRWAFVYSATDGAMLLPPQSLSPNEMLFIGEEMK